MTIKPSNAGPYTVGLSDDLGPNQTRNIRLENLYAGPRNQQGWFKKLFGRKSGMDYLYVQNGSEYKVHIEKATGEITTVQSATSSNISGPVNGFTIWHENSGTTISANNVDIQVGNNVRQDQNSPNFSVGQLVRDAVPGFD